MRLPELLPEERDLNRLMMNIAKRELAYWSRFTSQRPAWYRRLWWRIRAFRHVFCCGGECL